MDWKKLCKRLNNIRSYLYTKITNIDEDIDDYISSIRPGIQQQTTAIITITIGVTTAVLCASIVVGIIEGFKKM
jgi:type VI protein secretion system component VasF